MMIKNTFKTIRKTKGKFFSILAIVAVGVAFFSGILACAPNMKYNADLYFDQYNLMDYRILSNFGLTNEDIRSIEAIDKVEGVMPAYSKDVIAMINEKESVFRIHSLDVDNTDPTNKNYINQIIVLDGRLPAKSGECIVEQSTIMEDAIKIGDKITIKAGDDDPIEDSFNTTSYEVVGIMHTPYYLSYEKGSTNIGSGNVDYYMYVPESDFNMEVYTEAFVTIENAKEYNSYDDSYFDYLEDTTNQLESLGIDRSEIRRNDILDKAQAELDKYTKEYEEGKQKYEEEIAKAKKDLEAGKLKLLEGRLSLQSKQDVAQAQFISAQMQIDTNKEQVAMIQGELDNAVKEYDIQNAELNKQKEEAQKQLDEALQQEQTAKAAYDEQKSFYDNLNAVNEEKSNCQIELETAKLDNQLQQQEIDFYQGLLASETDPAKIEEYEAKIAQAQEKIKQNDELIAQKEARINEIDTQYPNLEQDLVDASVKLAQLQTEYEAFHAQVELLQKTISTIDQGQAAAKKVIDDLQQKINDYNQKIADGQAQLEAQKAQAAIEFAKAEQELSNATTSLAKGEIELAKQEEKGKEELEDAYDELVKAQDEIDQIAQANWYILDRNSHYSYVDYKGAADRIAAIAKVFPVFFYFVAALVCLTTMTRMVDEERNEIGTLKALGYRNSQIAFKYVAYAAIASILGSIIGLAIGAFSFPYIIYMAWNMMYLLPSTMKFEMQWDIMIIAMALSVVITTLASFSSCYKSLIEVPSSLMRPKAPKLGKKIILERIDAIWRRLSFTSKVTFRNIFRYKKRFFMTVVGISGCTALIVAGFGIKDSINTIVDKQFEEVFMYNGIVSIDDKMTNSEKAALVEDIVNTSSIDRAYLTYMENGSLSYDNKDRDVTICVIDDTETFNDFVDLHERESKQPLSLSANGIIITERMANALNIKVGDEINLKNNDGMIRSFAVDGISENYVNHYVYMTNAAYKNSYGIRAVNNSILIETNETYQDNDAMIAKELNQLDGVETMNFYTAIKNNFQDMIKSLDYIVIVLIISAGALAFVVLYNLTNVNISERTREIATLMVLGFNNKEVNRYIYNENILLTFIGSIVGLGLGKILHLTIMVVVELDYIMFGRVINNISYVYAVVITLLFAIIVNQVMKKKLREIPMVESLKSVE
ncbi:MAG: ABC transporter permease [Erysipelotrichaceae bacterium]|nr:ABC transporter permease [Erysipelotrichaceae bacterium]